MYDFIVIVQNDELDVDAVYEVSGPRHSDAFEEEWEACIVDAVQMNPDELDIENVKKMMRDRGWRIDYVDCCLVGI